MNKARYILQALLLILLSTYLAEAQTPQKLHDLKSLTDSSGTVHLFYRIYAEHEETDYYTDNIYHYNTATGKEQLLLEHYYDLRHGYPFASRILEWKFLENDPGNYVYIRNADMFTYVSRSDSVELMGGHLATMEHLNVEGSDSGRVYVKMLGEVIIGRNGGRDWPDADAETFDQIPDSSKLGFPLTSVSPYNDSLMFGRDYSNSDGKSAFLRSLDERKTSEFQSDTLLPNNIYFDSDSSTIYIIDRLSKPEPDTNCNVNICNYGLFTNTNKGNAESWRLKQSFPSNIDTPAFPKVFVNPGQSGRLYIWNGDSVLVSNDYGENMEVLINPREEITGFTATTSGEYYTTNSTLYKLEGENSVELFSIPVSNEPEVDFPKEFELLQNYPNPFNPTTTIRFTLPERSQVSLVVYDMLGREVATLVNEALPAGEQSVRFDASNLSNGVYIYKLSAGSRQITRKMTLIK